MITNSNILPIKNGHSCKNLIYVLNYSIATKENNIAKYKIIWKKVMALFKNP